MPGNSRTGYHLTNGVQLGGQCEQELEIPARWPRHQPFAAVLHHRRMQRLDKIVVCAAVQPGHSIRQCVPLSDDDGWQRLIAQTLCLQNVHPVLLGQAEIKRTFNPGFRIALHQKDLNLALQGAKTLSVALPQTACVAQLMQNSGSPWLGRARPRRNGEGAGVDVKSDRRIDGLSGQEVLRRRHGRFGRQERLIP
jgi:hypothetical protein